MMMSRFLTATLLLFLIFQLTAASTDEKLAREERRAARKPYRPQGGGQQQQHCMSRCDLSKQLGNVTEHFTDKINKLDKAYKSAQQQQLQQQEQQQQQQQQQQQGSQNLASSTELNILRSNLTKKMDGKIKDIFTYIADKEEIQKIKERTKPCCAEERLAEMTEELENTKTSISDLHFSQQNVTDTVNELLKHNVDLRENAKALQEVAEAVREQNEQLNSQNRMLVKQAASMDKKLNDLDERITILEKEVAEDNCTCDYVQVGLLSAAMEPPLVLGSQSITTLETNQRESEAKILRLEDWVKLAVQGETWLPTLEPPINPILQGNIDQAPRDCFEIYHMGFRESGPYKIQPDNSPVPFEVFCEQRYNGGGWTVIQRRRDGTEDFDRSYEEYAKGFGDVVGEFWLGNDKIHHLTSQGPHVMHAALQDWNNVRRYAEYDDFFVDTPRNSYMLRFGMFRGTAGDALRGSSYDGSKNILFAGFSAQDYDNDRCRPCIYDGTPFESCARLSQSGWWFHACSNANLNGPYLTQEQWAACVKTGGAEKECIGVKWNGGDEGLDNISLRASIVMVRPKSGA